ncbi:stonin-2 isoform 1-T1 [Clarias gariepinus]
MAEASSSNIGGSHTGWVTFNDEPLHTGNHSSMRVAGKTQPLADSHWEISVAGPVMQHSSWVQFDEKPWTSSSPPRHPPLPHPPSQVKDSSVCLEDEGINMDILNCTSNVAHTNRQSITSTSRFASWVTFDNKDEVEEQVCKHSPKLFNIRTGTLNSFHLQDTNSNLIVSSIQNQRADRPILDLTPDGIYSVFVLESPLLNSSTPYTKNNPFLHEDFSNIQPSPINPSCAYFNKSAVTSSNNYETQETPLALLFDYPVPNLDTHSFLFLSTTGNCGSYGGTYTSGISESLDQLKNMQIFDANQEPSQSDYTMDARDDEETLFKPAHMAPQDGWPMLLRIPEKKNIMSSRHWRPIFVRLSDAGQLRLYYEKGLENHFKEIHLSGQVEISEHKMQHYEENSRVHTLSLDQVVYKEKRKIQPKITVVHLPVKEQLLKLGTTDYQDFLSFRYALQEKLAVLSADLDVVNSSLPYFEEEIQVEVVDSFYGVLSKTDNRILKYSVMTRVTMLAFLMGSPPCSIGLNDEMVKGKEVVSRHDIIPNTTTHWICLWNCRLHECANKSEFTESRTISFKPPSGQRFELLCFRTTYAEKTLPFTLTTVISIKGPEVELQSWLVMSTGFSSNRDPLTLIPCENVAIRYPIPETWTKNFCRSVTGEKSLKARFNKGASFGLASTSESEPAMWVTLGTAKYEKAFRSVVWRISRLPDKNSALGHPHTFFCRLELGSDREVPHNFQSLLEVEFDMPAASASKTTVRSLSVQDRAALRKWVTYKAHYSYQVEITQKNKRTAANLEQAGPCTQQ